MLLEEKIQNYPEDIKKVILTVSEASKILRKGFLSRRGSSGTSNVYGEEQLALDKWADSLLINELGKSGIVKAIASEEQSELLEFDSSADIVVTLDPLDGSSLIDVNLTVGTIVGIQRGNVLKPGQTMIGALYILYGPLTVLVLSVGNGVHEFLLNDNGDYTLEDDNIMIPDGKIYSPGALRIEWLPNHTDYINHLEKEGYKLRYSGSFVADVHQILHKGGVFTYPAYKDGPKGKLRLLYECIPMSYIVKQSGGAASDGTRDLLSIEPTSIHQRTPIYVGGKKEITLIESITGGKMSD